MKVIYLKVERKDKAFISTAMEILSKDNGSMTKNIQVNTITKLEPSSKVSLVKDKCHME